MWEQLTEFTRIWQGLLCMMGDFNSSPDSNERLCSNVDTWAMDSIQLLLNSSISVDMDWRVEKTVKKQLHIRKSEMVENITTVNSYSR